MAKQREAYTNKKGIGSYTNADPGLRSVNWDNTQGERKSRDISRNVDKNAAEDGGFSGGIKYGTD